jgi:hypothetical protein
MWGWMYFENERTSCKNSKKTRIERSQAQIHALGRTGNRKTRIASRTLRHTQSNDVGSAAAPTKHAAAATMAVASFILRDATSRCAGGASEGTLHAPMHRKIAAKEKHLMK